MKRYSWKLVLALIVAIPLVTGVGRYLGETSAANDVRPHSNVAVSSKAGDPAGNDGVRAFATSQPSDGVSQKDFDIDFLTNLEEWTVDRVRVNTAKALKAQGVPDAKFEVSSSAVYVESDATKLAVIRIVTSHNGGGLYSLVTVGIVGNELRRVSCLRESREAIPFAYGTCANKIRETFGISLSP